MLASLVVKLLAFIIAAPFLLYLVWKFQLIDLVMFPDSSQAWQLPTSGWEIAISPNGEMLATVSGTMIFRQLTRNSGIQGHPSVEIRRVTDGSLIRRLDFFSADSLAFSPDNMLIAAGGYGGEINIWRISDGQKLYSLIGSDEPWSNTLVLAFTPNGQTLVALAVYYTSKTKLNQLSVWNVTTGKKRYSLAGKYTCAAISPDGQLLAVGSAETPLTLHRLGDGTPIRQLLEKPGWCFYLNFSPDGKLLAYLSGGEAGIRVYRVADGHLLHQLSPRAAFYNKFESLKHIAISPDGRILAAAYTVLPDASIFIGPSFRLASHGRIRFWRLDNGQEMPTVRGHRSGVYRLAFRPDGKLLASSGSDAKIRFWQVPPHNYIWLWLLLGSLIVLDYFGRSSLLNWMHR